MKKDFTILGIESTCDETSAALLKGGREIVTNVIYSQIEEHKKYHGVVPELASRAHAAKIATVIAQALGDRPLDCVAFASGPGLPGGLMVGRVAAETLAAFKGVPLIGVNHLEGHIFACDFEGNEVKNRLQFPLVALVVSGNARRLSDCGPVIFAVVVLHNAGGLALGYLAAAALRLPGPKRKALCIEVGMQNSGLAASLAAVHFAAYPMAAVPGAIFSVWHNLSGALVAWLFRTRS